MKTVEVRFKVPKEILSNLNQSLTEFTAQSKLYTALQLFKNHKLSFGKAAELAELSRTDFLFELNKNEIDFISYEASELEEELER